LVTISRSLPNLTGYSSRVLFPVLFVSYSFSTMKFICLVLCLAVYIEVSQASSKGPAWSYGGRTEVIDGRVHFSPSSWGNVSAFCDGRIQSPINIETSSVNREDWAPMVFKNYNLKPRRMRVKNNGHSAQVEIDAAVAPRIDGGGLAGEYVFAQFHFHWGRDSSMGSEHTINGVRYPMELHLVHFKGEYNGLKEAINKKDGLAVLGVLFKISATDNPAFTPIIQTLKEIQPAGVHEDVEGLYPLSAFIPRNRNPFYRYQGSLTTPTCNEVVTWTLFDSTVEISEAQMEAFRSLRFKDESPLVNNFRPPQPLYNRKVFMSSTNPGSDASHMKSMGISLYFLSSIAVVVANM